MSVDKLVDSTQLNSDLTSVANAIRTKSGGSGQLAFPSGFVSEIGNIPSGDIAYWGDEGCLYYKDMVIPSTRVTTSYHLCKYLETIYAPNATSFNNNAGGSNCLNLKSVHYPKCTTFSNYFIRQQGAQYSNLESVEIGSLGYPVTNLGNINWRYGSHAMNLTVTIYVDASTLAEIPSAVSSYANGNNIYAPSGSTVTIVYKNSTTGEVITA